MKYLLLTIALSACTTTHSAGYKCLKAYDVVTLANGQKITVLVEDQCEPKTKARVEKD